MKNVRNQCGLVQFRQTLIKLVISNLCSMLSDADLCLKYYRASRYRVRCVMIVVVELSALNAPINDLHLFKQL